MTDWFGKHVCAIFVLLMTLLATTSSALAGSLDPPVTSSSHAENVWSNTATIDLTWAGASDDTSGVDGYSLDGFTDDFSTDQSLIEIHPMQDSPDPNWWVSSGAYAYWENGLGRTVQGDIFQPNPDPRLASYQFTPSADYGVHPQNTFQMVLRQDWLDYQQTVFTKIDKYNQSDYSGRTSHNGMFLYDRYVDSQNYYYSGLRVDGKAIIKKKSGGAYTTLISATVLPGSWDRDSNPNLIPEDTWIGMRTEVENLGSAVRIKLYADVGRTGQWSLVAEALDDGSTGGQAFNSAGKGGIRTDFMDAYFDDYEIVELEPDVVQPPPSGSQKSVPVLLYHGISSVGSLTVSPSRFDEHMSALVNAGYTPITLDAFTESMTGTGTGTLPSQPVLITFDDGITTSYEEADSILAQYGFNAVMYLISDRSFRQGSPYYMDTDQVIEALGTQRWDMEAHAFDAGHNTIDIDAAGTQGKFFASKGWLGSEGRMETDAEYEQRVRTELQNVKSDIESTLGVGVSSFSFPFGDYGAGIGSQVSNHPGAEAYLWSQVTQIFDGAIFRQWFSPDKNYSQNYRISDTRMFKRISPAQSWTGSYLVTFLNNGTAKNFPFQSPLTEDIGWNKLWGVTNTGLQGLVVGTTSGGDTNFTILDGTLGWRDYTFKTRVVSADANSIDLVARARDKRNYVRCLFYDDEIRIIQVVDGSSSTLKSTSTPVSFDGAELGVRVEDASVDCIVDDSTMLSTTNLSSSLSFGGIGYKMWFPSSSSTVTLADLDVTSPISADPEPGSVLAGPDGTINEGSAFIQDGSFTDPDSQSWTATADYDDGAGAEPLFLSGQTFQLNHVYGNEGTHDVSVTITAADGEIFSDAVQVTANNVAPAIAPKADVVAFIEEKVNLGTVGFSDPGGLDTHTAFVDWGPRVKVGNVNQTRDWITGSYRYSNVGAHTVTITLTDDAGATDDMQFTVTVPDAPLTDDFSADGLLGETAVRWQSPSPIWWVQSGAMMTSDSGTGQTIQGPLESGSPWQISYADNPLSDGGLYPQNVFKLITKSKVIESDQESYFRINADNLSVHPDRNATNGLFLINRYRNSGLTGYYAGLQVNGMASIRKMKGGDFYTLAETPVLPGTYDRESNPSLLPKDEWIGLRTEIRNGPDLTVNIKLYSDMSADGTWTQLLDVTDDSSSFGGRSIPDIGYSGIRTDFMDVEFDDYMRAELPIEP